MFNECHIHLCYCTWSNVFSLAQSLLIKHKKIFECFSIFGKSFVFCKIVKNSKNSVALFWRLSRKLVLVACPSREPTQRFFTAHWQVNVPIAKNILKILRIFFKIWVFNVSRDSIWRLVHGWRFQPRRVHRDFCCLPRDSLVGRTFSRKKHLEKFSKFLF